MACQEKNSAKHLNFKSIYKEPLCESKITSSSFQFGENLKPSSGKSNVSSLRIPADTSWPKIPQRRFADSVGDIIDQPCVVTVTGTPGRSRTIVRTPNSLITSKETVDPTIGGYNFGPNSQSIPQPLKRRPGCIDPRFKKVTTVKSQIKSTKLDEENREIPTETCHSVHIIPNQMNIEKSEKMEHSIPEKDINVLQVNQQEAVKSNGGKFIDSKSQINKEESKELTKAQTYPENFLNQQNENCLLNLTREDNKDVSETSPKANCEFHENSKLSQENCQETRKILSKGIEVESKKILDLIPDDKCMSFKLSTDSNGILDETKELEEERKESLCFCDEKANSQIKKISSKAVPCEKCLERFKTFIKSPEENGEGQIESDVSESLSDDELYRTRCKEHMDDKESFMPATTDSELVENETVTTLNRKKKFLNYFNSAGEESNYSAKDYESIDFFQTHGDFYKFHQAIDFSDLDEKKGKLSDNPNFKQKIKSEQNLSRGVWQNSRNSEPLIPMNQRRCATSYSKKKSECSQGKEEMTDSEFAFLWPEQQRTRRKSSHGYSQKLIEERRNKSCDLERRNIAQRLQNMENHLDLDKNSPNCRLSHFKELKKHCCNKLYQDPLPPLKAVFVDPNIQEINSPRTETDIASEKPKRIPIKTQKLLSKSYWEYYRKLNRNNKMEDPQKQYFSQVSAGSSQIQKKRGNVTIYEEQSELLSPPEIRTLKRCSVLSSMINKKLDSSEQPTGPLYTKQSFINNVKSSSHPTDELYVNQIQSEIPLRSNGGSSVSSKSENKRKNTQVEINLIKLQTIAFFGILMYIIIIFLPMLYDHIFHEDYDDYADLTYIELALDYVVSSYREAFNGIVDFVNKIIYRPVSV